MGNIPQEIPNTRHVPQPNGDDDLHIDGFIPNSDSDGGAGMSGQAAGFFGARKSSIPNTTDPILQMINNLNNGGSNSPSDGSVTDADGNQILNGEDRFLAELGLMQGLNTNFSHSNKWIGYFPLANVLGKKYSNLELNLVRFSIP